MTYKEPYIALAPVMIYALGALLDLVDRRTSSAVSHATALLGSLVGLAVALNALLSGSTQQFTLFAVAPFASLSFRLDPLAAYFLLVISVVAAAVSLYAIGYLRGEHGSSVGLGAAFNGFLATMALVVLADSVFAFLFAWEAMSLVSFFLVIHHSEQKEVRRAGFVYLVMTHAGTAFLLVGFFLLSTAAGSLDFEALRAASTSLSPLVRDSVFLLALVAFGTKAGIIPLHVWLPRAHPAAPSHVSALMSGVMIKTAIYGLLRIGWELAGPGPVWWGGLILALGAASAVLGVLYALMEHDLKRLLAYHSVENIGIILMGLGAAFLLAPLGHPTAAALALLACLYHVLNHAVFKGLLFLGAGAVQQATRTRDLESLGGLIRRMPWTGVTFLVGAAAISALPPLNGFASEWLTFQSLLAVGTAAAGPVLTVGAAAAAGLLSLTGGLAAFCFVKAFGIAFLGMPRGAAAGAAREVGRPMLLGMGLLAVLCFALGLIPTGMARLLAPVTSALVGAVAQPSLSLTPLPATTRGGSLAPLALLGLLVALGLLAFLLGRLIGGPVQTRLAPPWCCGITLEPSMQYSASALAKPVRIVFRTLVRPYNVITRTHGLGIPYFVSSVQYEAGIHPVYERYLYTPTVRALLTLAHQIRLLQTGSLRTYLAYVFATLVVVLLLTR
ncbi:MAG: hydrogenase 4 subunit B [Chloroflexota bacterium]|nr:MAG: hydrogenase 4 subunit B [Chloroflexota bacterium]